MQAVKLFVVLLWTGLVLSDRLPDIFRPQHYELRILTHLNGTDQLRFEGEVKIRFHVIDQTENITLHAKNLTIDQNRITLNYPSGRNCIRKTEFNEKQEFYILHLCEILEPTVEYELFMPFEGPLNSNQTGYYWSSYNDTGNNQTSYLAVTQFSPTFARLAFPCFDEPHLKANFRLTLGYHRNNTGITNTPIVNCTDHKSLKNYVWCEHEKLLRTSTYLVAYAVHNLTSVATQSSDTAHNVTFTSWMQAKVVNEGSFLANLAPKVLSYLEKLLEYSFPLRKVDQLAVPTHKFSAMENWGLVTFKESRFVHNDSEEMLESKESKAYTMAHEYTHQWFGNLVTMKWWNDLWLKEGPSNYFGYVTLDALIPHWRSGERNFANDLGMFFQQDAINSTISISRDVQGSENILKQFSEYVYKKGSLTMRMLHKLLGDEVFYAGIRSYVKQYAYDNVIQSDLWQTMQEALNVKDTWTQDLKLSTIMDSWTVQPGYPLVSVIRDYETGSLRLNQTRFWLNADQAHANSCWWIPLSFVSQHEANFNETQPQFWLKCPSTEQTLLLNKKTSSDEWIMLNPQVNSIYRVNYDNHNWHLIINSLNSSEHFTNIHVLNRAQLIDDLMALAWTNIESYELALSLLEYLPREPNYIPWKRAIQVLNRHGDLLQDTNAQIFKNYMIKLLAPLFERCDSLETLRKKSPSMEELLLCRLVYFEACRYGLENCISQAMAFTLETDMEQVDVNFRDIVYCTNIEHSSNELQFQLMMQRFQNSAVATRKTIWASGLGCSGNFTQLQQFLDYLLLQPSEATTGNYYVEAVTSALRRKHVALQTTNHILQHATTINDKLNAKQIKQMILLMVENDTIEEEKLAELKTLKKFEEPLQNALEMWHVNQIWLTKRSEEFIRALQKYI